MRPETTIRRFINIVAEGEGGKYVAPPPETDPADAEHYDALKQTGFFGAQAAGCIFISRATGRILLMLRSQGVEESGTWGNCGGAHKSEEAPIVAAEREGREETGYAGELSLVPLLEFRSGTFRYSNFAAVVDDEFSPHLGWEADDSRWCEFGDWPEPLHFGMEALFSDPQSVTKIKAIIAA